MNNLKFSSIFKFNGKGQFFELFSTHSSILQNNLRLRDESIISQII